MHCVSVFLEANSSHYRHWGCTFPWIPGIHVLAGMRRWRRRWHNGGHNHHGGGQRYVHHDMDYDYDNHHDDDRYNDYCIVDYSGCGMHYDSRCDALQSIFNLFLSSPYSWSFLLLVVGSQAKLFVHFCNNHNHRCLTMFLSMNQWVEDTGVV